MQLVLPLTVFFLVLLFSAGITAIFSAVARQKKQRRLQSLFRTDANRRETPPGATWKKERRPNGIRFVGRRIELAWLENLVSAANVSPSAERWVLLSLMMGIAGFLLAMGLFRHLFGAVTVMGLGIALPFFYLVHKRHQQDDVLVRQLPDALDMIVRALRVGQSVDNALREVAETCPAPLGDQFTSLYEEMTLGIPFAKALKNFEKRFSRLPDVKLMTTAFTIQRETGGNLVRVLANLAELIRDRYTLKRQIRALTAEGRSSALILGVLPLAVLLIFWIVRPAYIQLLFTHPAGRQMVLVAALLEIGGFIVMRIMTRLEP